MKMDKDKKFLLIEAATLQQLEEDISKFLKKGWVTQGDVSISFVTACGYRYTQTIFKCKK